MADWGHSEGAQRADTYGMGSAGTTATTIATPGSANTKGAWTELVAAAPFDVSGIIVHGSITAASFETILFDLGIGAAASEAVIVPNVLQTRLSSANSGIPSFFLPISIPAGARIAARYQRTAAGALSLGVTLLGGGANYAIPGQRIASLGANLATSKGALVDPGTTINTKGAWTELAASTDFASSHALIVIGPDTALFTDARWLMDVAIGASGSEQIIIADMYDYNMPGTGLQKKMFIPLAIPAGSRVSARAQCTGNAAARILQLNILTIG